MAIHTTRKEQQNHLARILFTKDERLLVIFSLRPIIHCHFCFLPKHVWLGAAHPGIWKRAFVGTAFYQKTCALRFCTYFSLARFLDISIRRQLASKPHSRIARQLASSEHAISHWRSLDVSFHVASDRASTLVRDPRP